MMDSGTGSPGIRIYPVPEAGCQFLFADDLMRHTGNKGVSP
jgi:hypothetical protein